MDIETDSDIAQIYQEPRLVSCRKIFHPNATTVFATEFDELPSIQEIETVQTAWTDLLATRLYVLRGNYGEEEIRVITNQMYINSFSPPRKIKSGQLSEAAIQARQSMLESAYSKQLSAWSIAERLHFSIHNADTSITINKAEGLTYQEDPNGMSDLTRELLTASLVMNSGTELSSYFRMLYAAGLQYKLHDNTVRAEGEGSLRHITFDSLASRIGANGVYEKSAAQTRWMGTYHREGLLYRLTGGFLRLGVFRGGIRYDKVIAGVDEELLSRLVDPEDPNPVEVSQDNPQIADKKKRQ